MTRCQHCGHKLRPYSDEEPALVVDAPEWPTYDGPWTGVPSPDGRYNCPPDTYVTPGYTKTHSPI